MYEFALIPQWIFWASFHGGKFFFQIGPTFNNFLTFYSYKLKFEALLDTFKIRNLVVQYKFFGGKMTSQNGVQNLNLNFRTFIWLWWKKSFN